MTVCAAYACNMDSSIDRISMFFISKRSKKEKNMDSTFKRDGPQRLILFLRVIRKFVLNILMTTNS